MAPAKPSCTNSPVGPGASPTQATISKCHSKGHRGQTVEEAAKAASRGHQETPRVDSGQGLAEGIIWPSVTGIWACSPKWTDVPGAEIEHRLLSNLFFYSRLCSQYSQRFDWGRRGDPGNHQPSSLPPRSHWSFAIGQSLSTKAAASSTSWLQPTLLSVLSWSMKKRGLVFASLLHRYLLFISEEWL